MELRRNQMKYFSSDNMRLLSSLILSLSSKQSSMENKLIDYWTPSTAYIKDESMVIYDDAIQICKISNADDTFNQNKWLKLSPEIDEVTEQQVRDWIGLSSEQIDTLSKIILDSEVRLDKTWSSTKVYSSIQDAIDTSKAFTLAELGKASGASYRVVSSTGEMTEQKYIYLMSDSSGSYNMYIVEDDGSTVMIGDTNIDLTNYYTKTEVDNDFLKKTDATSTYATITTVDGKVNKTDIVDNLTSTDTDKPLSANQGKVLKDEVDLKANDSDVVKKTDIKTTLDENSTNDDVYGGKAIFDAIKKSGTGGTGGEASYSTDEQVIGTWIDGKPIYRKVLEFGSIATGSKSIDISNLNCDKAIKIYGTGNYNTMNGYQVPFPFNDRQTCYQAYLQNNKTIIFVASNTYYNAKIIIEYTKTTDA